MAVSDLHHLRLPRQRNQWRQALTGVGQSAVDVELHVHVAALEPAHSQDNGVGAAVGKVGVLQVNGVDLPISPDVPHQDWRRRQEEETGDRRRRQVTGDGRRRRRRQEEEETSGNGAVMSTAFGDVSE